MAKVAQCFLDNGGQPHTSPEAAVSADIATAIGRGSADGGMITGLAALILDKRAEIEAAFADYDRMKGVVS